MNAYVIGIGAMVFPYFTDDSIDKLVDKFHELISANKPFTIKMDKDGPRLILNPSPGMAIVIMTKDQFERNRNIASLIPGRA